MKILRFLPLVFVVALFAACGGSSGGSGDIPTAPPTPPPPPETSTGVLTPVPIAGLSYRTASESGETNTAGEFRFRVGEAIEFFLGATPVGSAVAFEELSLFDLRAAAPLADIRSIVAALDEPSSPFTVTINTARMLYSLDDDQDLSTGVGIPAEVATLLESTALDFELTPSRFANSADVQMLLSAVDRTLIPLEAVLADQYRAFGIALMEDTVGVSRITEQRASVDGGAFSTVVTRATNEYDPFGNLLRQRAFDTSGELVSLTTYGFDAQGLGMGRSTDSDGDGVTDVESQVTRNLAGDVVQIVTRFGSGTDDQMVSTRVYDDQGREVERREDQGGDGAVELIRRTFYAGDGMPSRIEVESVVPNGGEFVLINDYDEAGLLVEQSFQGTGRDWNEFSDERPPPLAESIVDAFDPLDPYWGIENVFTVSGAATLKTRRTLYIRDAQGRVVERSTDNDGDGVPDQVARLSFQDGRPLLWSYDAQGDGSFESTATYEYSEVGQLVLVREEREVSGRVALATRTVDVDRENRRTRIDTSANGVAAISGEQVFTYDGEGSLSTIVTSDFGFGFRETVLEPSFRVDNSRLYAKRPRRLGPYQFEYREVGEPIIRDALGREIGSLKDELNYDVSLHFQGLTATYTARLVLSRLSTAPQGFDFFYREPREGCNAGFPAQPLIPAETDGSRPLRAYYREDENRFYVPDPASSGMLVHVQSRYATNSGACSGGGVTTEAALFYPLVPTDLVIEYPLTIEGIDDPIEPNFELID